MHSYISNSFLISDTRNKKGGHHPQPNPTHLSGAAVQGYLWREVPYCPDGPRPSPHGMLADIKGTFLVWSSLQYSLYPARQTPHPHPSLLGNCQAFPLNPGY